MTMPRGMFRTVSGWMCVCGFALCVPLRAGETKKQDSRLYELRTYTTAEGKLPDLHKRFREHTMKLFEKHGMTNVMYWTPTSENLKENTLVYFVAHKDEAAAKKSWDGFRNDPVWQKVFKESRKDGPIVTKVVSRYLRATGYSPSSSLAKADRSSNEPLLYELRTYTANEGKLPNLHARFRDHTMKLFKKHGITNVIYWTPTDEKLKDNTLVYLIAHKNAEAAKTSWDGFRNDPDWKKVARESQQDGRILVRGGVKTQYLVPTDYSPIK